MMLRTLLTRCLAGLVLAGAASAAFAQFPPGPFDKTWDWIGNARILTYCTDAALPAVLSMGARNAALNLTNANFGWRWIYKGLCPAGWNLRRVAPGLPNLRVRAAALRPLMLAPGGFPKVPYDHNNRGPYPDPYDPYRDTWPNPNDQMPPGGGGGGGGGAPRFAQPPLAYFQAGPFIPGRGREIRYAEIVYNWQIVNGKADPPWSTIIGSEAFDPIQVGMHEFGHAIRLDHDDFIFDGDVTVFPTGSRPGANKVIIQPAPGKLLATPKRVDDMIVAGDLTSGANGVADSGKKMNVMETFCQRGQHGINPFLGIPPGRYSYTDRERVTALAASRHKPARGGRMQIAPGRGRMQSWNGVTLFDAAANPVATYAPGTLADDPATDFLVDSTPAAVRFTGDVQASAFDLPGVTQVHLDALFSSPNASATAPLRVWIPFSPNHPSLQVTADWQSDTVTIADGATVLCAGSLNELHPVDCSLDPDNPDVFSAGIIDVELTNLSLPYPSMLGPTPPPADPIPDGPPDNPPPPGDL